MFFIIIGCQMLREFSFNEDSTESYIETINECSIMDSSNNEDDQHILSDLRDEPTSFYCQELQSTYVNKNFRIFIFILIIVIITRYLSSAVTCIHLTALYSYQRLLQ